MVSFVYFDLGGVIIKDFSDTEKWEQLKRELGIPPQKEADFDQFWNEHEPDICTGKDVETLLPLLKAEFGARIPENYSLLNDGFVKRFEVNESIWPVIDKILYKSRLGLITNMYPGMYEAIIKKKLTPPVKWEVIIDSSVVGLLKPDTRIFELAENQAKVPGNEILFVDNSQMHVDAARKFGWQAFLYYSSDYESSSKKLAEKYYILSQTGDYIG